MRKVAIFLGGSQGSGKSTAASFIKDHLFQHGWIVHVLKFADPVYEITNYVDAFMSNIVKREIPKKNGPLMQKMGTDIGRQMYGQNIWVDYLKSRIDWMKDSTGNVCFIIEDTRMENELDLQDRLEGIETTSIYLDATEESRKPRTESWRENTSHQSEQAFLFQDFFKYTIDTNGDIENKNAVIKDILGNMKMFLDPKESLEELLAFFNAGFAEWSSTGYGANFDWKYGPKGFKELHIRDIGKIETLPEDKTVIKIKEVEEVMNGLEPGQA